MSDLRQEVGALPTARTRTLVQLRQLSAEQLEIAVRSAFGRHA